MKGIIAIDVETTGISPEKERMIEIGAFRPETGEIFRTLIHPGRPLPEKITELTGITDEMLVGAPEEKEAIGALLEFLHGDTVLLGHNICFDHSFLVQAIRRCGFEEPEFAGIDTLKISRVLCPELPNKKLETMVAHFGLTNERAHRAFEDARVTAELYQCLKRMNREPELFEPVSLYYKSKKTEPMTPKQRSFLTAILQYHQLEGQYSMENLTKSEASRLIDKLLLAYGRVPYRH
ncbi:MAG: 3'-5' exoribonuclease [Lachnospiraceae bacterium]|nr:3'-5' exoribonuclease [Lachnospiraceae bacterium]